MSSTKFLVPANKQGEVRTYLEFGFDGRVLRGMVEREFSAIVEGEWLELAYEQGDQHIYERRKAAKLTIELSVSVRELSSLEDAATVCDTFRGSHWRRSWRGDNRRSEQATDEGDGREDVEAEHIR